MVTAVAPSSWKDFRSNEITLVDFFSTQPRRGVVPPVFGVLE